MIKYSEYNGGFLIKPLLDLNYALLLSVSLLGHQKARFDWRADIMQYKYNEKANNLTWLQNGVSDLVHWNTR